MIKSIAFTMYPATSLPRARDFYERLLGLHPSREFGGAWIEYDLENGTFALTTMAEGRSPDADAGGAVAFEGDDVDGPVARLREQAVRVKLAPFSTPVCRMAVVLDSEGNAVTLHQAKLA